MMHEDTMYPVEVDEIRRQMMDTMSGVFAETLREIEDGVPAGRYRALAVTALEESAMWAIKGMTHASDGSPIDDPNKTRAAQ